MESLCITGKMRHKSEEGAHRHRRAMVVRNAKLNKIHKNALNVYKCPYCPYYHIGHSKPKPKGESDDKAE